MHRLLGSLDLPYHGQRPNKFGKSGPYTAQSLCRDVLLRVLAIIPLLFTSAAFHAQAATVQVEMTRLAQSACSGTFVAHTLPHTTTVQGAATPTDVRMYDSNGSG